MNEQRPNLDEQLAADEQAVKQRSSRLETAVAVGMAIVGAVAVLFLIRAVQTNGPAAPGPSIAQTAVAVAVGTPTPAPTVPAPPTPTVAPTPAGPRPAPAEVLARYLQAWEKGQYSAMHGMLTAKARSAVPQDRFVGRYEAIFSSSGLSVKTTPGEPPKPLRSQDVIDAAFSATFKNDLFGEFGEKYTTPLVYEDGDWRVDWTPALIFAGLTNDLVVQYDTVEPLRGSIKDRAGRVLAGQGTILSLGVIPGKVKDREAAIKQLAEYLGISGDPIRAKMVAAQPGWWVPLKDFNPDKRDELAQRFGGVAGVEVHEKNARIYPFGPSAAHAVGYVSGVTEDDLKTLTVKGYSASDIVGRFGMERSQEELLRGTRGGRLAITKPAGELVRIVQERKTKDGGDVQLTLDGELQRRAFELLGDRAGSLVLLDPRDNGVVALASSPSFDPNGFVTGFTTEEFKKLTDDPNRPFQMRPTLSSYATGSTFKTITMAAGLEKGGFKPESPFTCNGKWSLPSSNIVFGDWVPRGHGRLDLAQGLVESCDIVFYELGKKLNEIDATILPAYSHQFGLGELTGIQGVPEAEGIVPSPEWKKKALDDGWYPGDAVNLAIGQGYLDATPLQLANVYSTIANNGVLRAPLLIRRIVPGDGTAGKEMQAAEKRRVPVSPRTFATIRDSMKKVASAPKGTANYAMAGYRIPVAAKTGSSENQAKDNAWFAGFAPADAPQIVVIVMIEGGEHGGTVAAPLGRLAFEAVLGK